jgi:hypothetical protein
MPKLTPKQERFVSEYQIDLNATQAAIRAGVEWLPLPSAFYVYFLIDPRNGGIFYVGKGKGRRMYAHAPSSRKTQGSGAKSSKIIEIEQAGHKVKEVVFATYDIDADAYAVERTLIKKLKDKGLTNISSGSVSPNEALSMWAKTKLAQLPDFEDWFVALPQGRIDTISSVFGGARDCYEWYRKALGDLCPAH